MRRESFRILARSAEGRGRSTGPVARPDSTLLSVYHSWTIVSVTAVTFTARSVHSRAIDPDTLHFQGSPRLEQGQWRSASCQLWLARLPLPRLQIQSPLPPTPATLLGADDIWITAHNGVDPPRSNPMFITWFPSSDESRPRRLVSSRSWHTLF